MMRVQLSYRNCLLNGSREIRMKLEGNERLGDNNVQEKQNSFKKPLFTRPDTVPLAPVSVLWSISHNTEALAVGYSLYSRKVWRDVRVIPFRFPGEFQRKSIKSPKQVHLLGVPHLFQLHTSLFACLRRARILK